MSKPSGIVIVLAVLLLGSLKALYLGAVAALMSELFLASTRATGLGHVTAADKTFTSDPTKV